MAYDPKAIETLTGDGSATGPGSAAFTLEEIQGNPISGTTGTGNVVFSTSPTFTGTIIAASANLSGSLTAATLSSPGVSSITNSTASTVPTNGALVVTGGLGVGNNINIAGYLGIEGSAVSLTPGSSAGLFLQKNQTSGEGAITSYSSSGNNYLKFYTNSSGNPSVLALTLDATQNLIASGNATLGVGKSLTLQGSSSGTLSFSAGASTASYSLSWPVAQGGAKTNLQNDGSGNLSWVIPSSQGLIKSDLYDPVDTTLTTGSPVTIDGVTVTNGMLVLYSNLGSGNNEIYQATVVGGNVTAWTAQAVFTGNSITPSAADTVIVKSGTGFAEQIAIFNGSNWFVNSAIRQFNQADYWESSSIFNISIVNNTTAQIFSIAYLNSENMEMDYSIKRGTSKETGKIYITTDGSNVALSSDGAGIGLSGVLFSGAISGSNIIISYTADNSGSAGTIKYKLSRWADAAGGPGGPPSYSSGGGGSVTGSGTNQQIAFWNGGTTLTGNANFLIDTTNQVINLNGLQQTILNSSIINDNQSSPATVFSFSSAQFSFAIVEYSVQKSGAYRTGRMLIATDGSSVNIEDDYIEQGATGVVFSVSMSGSNVLIQYVSTSTGASGTFKYSYRRWQ